MHLLPAGQRLVCFCSFLSKSATPTLNNTVVSGNSWLGKFLPMVAYLRTNAVGITRTKKRVYPRMYKVCIVNPDGSSFSVRHPEPRGILQLPVDVNTLSEEERLARTRRLRDEKEVKVEHFNDSDVKFDRRAALARFTRKK